MEENIFLKIYLLESKQGEGQKERERESMRLWAEQVVASQLVELTWDLDLSQMPNWLSHSDAPEWEKVFADHLSDRGLPSRIHEEIQFKNKRQPN